MALGTIFSEADSSCYKDVSKMYFGGNKGQLLYYDENSPEINIEALFRSLSYNYKDLSGGDRHYKENPTEETTGAANSPENGGTSPVPIINDIVYIKGYGENHPFFYCINFGCTNKSSIGKTAPNHKPYRANAIIIVYQDVKNCPYHVDFLYKLAAFYLGYEFDPDEKQSSEIISHNGFTSHFAWISSTCCRF